MYNVLICDDEKDIVSALRIYLTAPDIAILEAYDGAEALEVIAANDIHLVLMDIMMPKLDGISAVSKLRESSNIPVILLTAKSEDVDKILGLNIGADDYITKPFNPMEVIARVRSQLRRYTQLGGIVRSDTILSVGAIELDTDSRTVTADGAAVNLTPTEYRILKLLMEKPGKVFSGNEIYTAIRNEDAFGTENIVAVHIRHLREKIEINPAEPRYIKVVWGQGYKIDGGERQ
ncbi:MAG: response regulator transcription factor [Oscillospiraceae bacterium]|jgi:DNA-binding response OmpR family regulator|nr:response regulator transcription factor [Oscillospiraceae bacterium]